MDKDRLFADMKPAKALAKMALPTVGSQIVILIYNLADTWFIGRTNDPNMIGASSLALTVYLAAVALSNVFGVGGGALMVRLLGENKPDEARKVASYTMSSCAVSALVFSLLVLIFTDPILTLLGADEFTIGYGRQYLITTTVIGGIPTIMSMCMPQLLRNSGFSGAAGFGVALGSILNVLLDPLFMFVILPQGNEVLGAGIATALANFISFAYFIVMFLRVKNKSVLSIPKKFEKIEKAHLKSFYTVGIPAAIAIFLFDLVTIVLNKLTVEYGNVHLAAMGIVLKLERLSTNIGLGVCLGMVPLVSYNYGAGNYKRMNTFSTLARTVIIVFSTVCAVLFFFFADSIVGVFIEEEETVRLGAQFLRGRCFSMPFMMIGYHAVNYMNAVDKGKVSFLLAIIRHVVLIIPIMLIMNAVWSLDGLVWSQLVADAANSVLAYLVFRKVSRDICISS